MKIPYLSPTQLPFIEAFYVMKAREGVKSVVQDSAGGKAYKYL
jgi:hypothetical protein